MMNRHIIIGFQLFLFLGLGALHARGEVADTLSAEVTESDWESGIVVNFTGETETTSVVQTEKKTISCNVLDLHGRMICKNVCWNVARKELPSGLYIVNRRKVVIRH